MANKGCQSVRQPATKFAKLQKKMKQNKVTKGLLNRKKK